MLAPGRCLFTTGINTHSNQRKSEAQISSSCKSLVTDTGKHNSAPNFEITNMSVSEHEGYRGALASMRAAKQWLGLSLKRALFPKAVPHTLDCKLINHMIFGSWTLALCRALALIYSLHQRWSELRSNLRLVENSLLPYVILVVAVCVHFWWLNYIVDLVGKGHLEGIDKTLLFPI